VKTFPPSKARKWLYRRLSDSITAMIMAIVTKHTVTIPKKIPPIVNSSAENSMWFGSASTARPMTSALLNAMSVNSPVNPDMIRTRTAFILSTRCSLVGVSTI
jgi:hypothetical protein